MGTVFSLPFIAASCSSSSKDETDTKKQYNAVELIEKINQIKDLKNFKRSETVLEQLTNFMKIKVSENTYSSQEYTNFQTAFNNVVNTSKNSLFSFLSSLESNSLTILLNHEQNEYTEALFSQFRQYKDAANAEFQSILNNNLIDLGLDINNFDTEQQKVNTWLNSPEYNEDIKENINQKITEVSQLSTKILLNEQNEKSLLFWLFKTSIDSIIKQSEDNKTINSDVSHEDSNQGTQGTEENQPQNSETNNDGNQEQDSTSKNNSETNNNQNQPHPPVFPPSFNWNTPANNTDNQYPDFVNEYKIVDDNKLYSDIYKRTFAVAYSTKLKELEGEQNDKIIEGQGTSWLLDYHKYINAKNKYKLFFATNLHVLSYFSNAMSSELLKHFNYQDPTGNQLIGIALGKAQHQEKNSKAIYYANYTIFTDSNFDSRWANKTQYTQGITNPRLVFAAFDYMDQASTKQYQEIIKQRYQEFIEHKDSNNEKIIKLNDGSDIPFYTDFAVFEVDIDLDKVDSTLTKWVREAIESLNNYAQYNTEHNQPNTTQSQQLWQNIDYYSASQLNIDHMLTNAKDIYIAGYPSDNQQGQAWMQNNPLQRNSDEFSYFRSPKNKDAFAFATNNVETASINIYTAVWNRLMASYYGVNYNIRFSSLYYGASGSMVLNQFNQLIEFIMVLVLM
ncbi:MIP family Ig-specific serine endopeptidase [[Mycoplasma] gypis]|uniref:DUF31 family protein n=1 Tax=[Mycoplasma] gypis TaxID=92404 RepID=A0ABZ2RPX6_9BACT|nr:DUF31 family protein [[Mycoplasma] gypis]MBN0919023.1 DUF31 family protein [[Mycoplasma] gypis]